MTTLDIIKQRMSATKFDESRELPDMEIREIVEYATYAPAGSTGERNTCLQYSRWCLKSQCLSRTLIQS